jgi:hypothetical protein
LSPTEKTLEKILFEYLKNLGKKNDADLMQS